MQVILKSSASDAPTAPPAQPVPSNFLNARGWSLTISDHLKSRLWSHLFPGDEDEHGAVLLAGVSFESAGPRLLVRDVVLAQDDIDYVPGSRGYRMLTASFVTRLATRCRDQRLVYLAVHNHRGTNHVAFSDTDLASQARGYPALLDVVNGMPVGALVIAKQAVAGRLWLNASQQLELSEIRVVGPHIVRLTAGPETAPDKADIRFDRQARLFGDRGQRLLAKTKVGIVGLGGIGSLIVEMMARIGVGAFVIADPDHIDETNLPRITGATAWDAMTWMTRENRPDWLRRLGQRLATSKVTHAKRLIRRANPHAVVRSFRADFANDEVARAYRECDYVFLAADSMRARLVFNALVHAYLIPGVQVGVKVPVDRHSGEVGDIFATARGVTPSSGCLWCNGLITPEGLQREAESPRERQLQRYVDEPEVKAPSVMTLNALSAAQAANDFLFAITGLTLEDAHRGYVTFYPRERRVTRTTARRDQHCSFCGDQRSSEFAKGDYADLPTIVRDGS